MADRTLTAKRLREVLRYDPATGLFKRRHVTRNWREFAGAQDSQGHVQIRVDGPLYAAHRLAWLYMTGEWPKAGVDHRNGIRSDNRWTNLRAATAAENCQNQVARCTNKSGVLGVRLLKNGKWNAQIQAGGKKKNLGQFDTLEEAGQAYLAAKQRLHAFQPTPRAAA